MTIYKEFNIGGGKGNPFGSFGAVISLVLFFVMLYFLAKGLFTILSWVAPVLLIGALVVDYKVVVDYGKFILKLLKDNPLMGIVGIVLTIVGFPVVSGFLFFKALARRTIKKKFGEAAGRKKEVFTEYEEVVEEEDFLKLPQQEKVTVKRSSGESNEYEDLFD